MVKNKLNCPFCFAEPCGNNECIYNKEYELSNDFSKKMDAYIENNEVSTSPTGSLRFNDGKPEFSQLDPNFILGLAEMMTKSAKKYGKYNWALGQQYHTPMDSCMRHLLKFMNGEMIDDESKMDHLMHAAANIMILWTSTKLDNKELDTRHKWSNENE